MCVFVHGRNVIHLNVRHEQFDINLNKYKSYFSFLFLSTRVSQRFFPRDASADKSKYNIRPFSLSHKTYLWKIHDNYSNADLLLRLYKTH